MAAPPRSDRARRSRRRVWRAQRWTSARRKAAPGDSFMPAVVGDAGGGTRRAGRPVWGRGERSSSAADDCHWSERDVGAATLPH